jgi:hypothetical protein
MSKMNQIALPSIDLDQEAIAIPDKSATSHRRGYEQIEPSNTARNKKIKHYTVYFRD